MKLWYLTLIFSLLATDIFAQSTDNEVIILPPISISTTTKPKSASFGEPILVSFEPDKIPEILSAGANDDLKSNQKVRAQIPELPTPSLMTPGSDDADASCRKPW